MNYGIIGRRLAGQRLGIGRYLEYLLNYWGKMASPSDQFTVYVREPLSEDGPKLPVVFKTHLVQPKLTGILWENLLLSRHAKDIDVLFCPNYTAPLNYRGPCVVATHSINEVAEGAHPWWYGLTYGAVYKLSAQKADAVIVPSQSVKEDLERAYRIPPAKIVIVPEGADESFAPIADKGLLKSTRLRYLGADKPYVLFVGKLSQRRNIPLIMESFAALKKRQKIPHSLLLFGPNIHNLPLGKMARQLGITDCFVQTNSEFTVHREMVAIYNAADLYVFPSLYEGFSLTTVEAMSCGVPVIAANRAALKEIAGGAAVMLDELTVEALSDAMGNILLDKNLREEVRMKCLEKARQFRWENTARLTLNVLQQVARN